MKPQNCMEGVELKFYAAGRSAYCPPSRTKSRAEAGTFSLSAPCSLSAKADIGRLRPTAQDFHPAFFVLFFLLLLASPAAHAKDAPAAPAVSRVQAQAFGLGYALRAADLQAVAYAKSVQALREVTDPQVAGAEVAHFQSEIAPLRRSEAESYTQAAALLTQMGAPASLRTWAAQSAAKLRAPLVYTGDARKLQKSEPDTAAVLSELVEIQSVKAAADAQQTPMTLWLELAGGKVSPWTADVGGYAADLHHAPSGNGVSRLSSVTAQVLLRHAPPGAPADTRESLAALIPAGGGNLQNLATIAPANVTVDKISHVYETLLSLYSAQKLAQALDKSTL